MEGEKFEIWNSLSSHSYMSRISKQFRVVPSSYTFSSVAQLCLTLCDPIDCSTPGLPVRYYLLEFTQTHGHWVGDAIQPSHPLSSPLLPPSIFPSIRVFSNESVLLIRWPECWSFSFNISPPMNIQDWFPLGWTGWISLQSKGLLRVPWRVLDPSPTPQFKNISSSVLSFLYSPTLTSIQDYWKNHSFD